MSTGQIIYLAAVVVFAIVARIIDLRQRAAKAASSRHTR